MGCCVISFLIFFYTFKLSTAGVPNICLKAMKKTINKVDLIGIHRI